MLTLLCLIITRETDNNAIANPITMSIQLITGIRFSELKFVIPTIRLLALTYQKVGVKAAISNTCLPRNSWGTKTPLIKQLPRAKTFAAPDMAFLLFTMFASRKLKLNDAIVKINEFSKSSNPFDVIIYSPWMNKLALININQHKTAKLRFPRII